MTHAIEAPGFQSRGQATAQRIVRRAAERERLGGTLLVSGPLGAGKGTFVGDLLALAFCAEADPSGRPCNACRGCRDARARVHPDLVIGSPDLWRESRSAGESIVAAARRWLLEASGAPVASQRRVVLIEGADRAGEAVQNALLKVLEEPTDRHLFVLIADEPWRLLPTIRSRSQPVRIGPVDRGTLVSLLVEEHRLPEDFATVLARLSHGLVGRAVRLTEDKEALTWRRTLQRELLDLLRRSRADRFAAARELLDEAVRAAASATVGAATAAASEEDGARTPAAVQRVAATALVEAWLELTRDLIVVAAGRPELAPGGELGPELVEAGAAIGAADLVRFAGLLEEIHAALRENAAPKLALERAMLAWPAPGDPLSRG